MKIELTRPGLTNLICYTYYWSIKNLVNYTESLRPVVVFMFIIHNTNYKLSGEIQSPGYPNDYPLNVDEVIS